MAGDLRYFLPGNRSSVSPAASPPSFSSAFPTEPLAYVRQPGFGLGDPLGAGVGSGAAYPGAHWPGGQVSQYVAGSSAAPNYIDSTVAGRSRLLEQMASSPAINGQPDLRISADSSNYASQRQSTDHALMATLAARQRRLLELVSEAKHDEQIAESRLAGLEEELSEEFMRVQGLKELLDRARADANAAETARLVGDQRIEEAIAAKRELEDRRAVLADLTARAGSEEQVAARRRQICEGFNDHESDFLDNGPASLEASELRSELGTAKEEMARQEARADSASSRMEELEVQVRLLRAEQTTASRDASVSQIIQDSYTTAPNIGDTAGAFVLRRQLEELSLGSSMSSFTAFSAAGAAAQGGGAAMGRWSVASSAGFGDGMSDASFPPNFRKSTNSSFRDALSGARRALATTGTSTGMGSQAEHFPGIGTAAEDGVGVPPLSPKS